MSSDHGHGHPSDDRTRLSIALGITIATAALGAVGALLTGSLALLADLGHLLTDGGALAAALIASLLAARAATARRTFGLGRAEVLVAALNALSLIAVVAWVGIEGVQRLFEPTDVPGLPVLVIGALGLVGNVASMLVLAGGDRSNMNMRGAALHVLGDALGSVGVIGAAVVLLTTGWAYADTIASLLIVALVLPRAIALLREAVHLLLEGTPRGIDVIDVEDALRGVDGVIDVHDLHVWAINDRTPALAVHLVVNAERPGDCTDSALDRAAEVLHERFDITHTTIQVEDPDHAGHERTCAIDAGRQR